MLSLNYQNHIRTFIRERRYPRERELKLWWAEVMRISQLMMKG